MTARKTRTDALRRDSWQQVTDRIVALLEQGVKPWERPWDAGVAASSTAIPVPYNAATKSVYRGINRLLMSLHPLMLSTGDPRFMTYKQAAERGYQVAKGSQGSTVFFYKPLEVSHGDSISGDASDSDSDDPDTKTVLMMRSYSIFHASQIEGTPEYRPPAPAAPRNHWEEPEGVLEIFAAAGADLREGGDRAFYSPAHDYIQMPPKIAFRSAEGWAAVALHELGHWTGHPSRLSRNLSGCFGDENYAKEELRAELASALVTSSLGIKGYLENHTNYVGSWIKSLKNDKREIFRAAADAQRIADFVLEFAPQHVLERHLPPDLQTAAASSEDVEVAEVDEPDQTLAPAP